MYARTRRRAQVEKFLKKLSEIFCFVFRTDQTENTFYEYLYSRKLGQQQYVVR